MQTSEDFEEEQEIIETRVKTNIDFVAKFGGSSLANGDRMLEAFKLVKEEYVDRGKTPAIVLSAMGKTTNNLLASGKRALKEGVIDTAYVKNLTSETIKQLDIPEV